MSEPDADDAPAPKKIPVADILAKHKAEMMAGVPSGSKGLGEPDHAYKARQAYRKAYEEHVGKFLSGELKHPKTGDVISHRDDALNMAHSAGMKAMQDLKKTGVKFSVYTD